MKRFSEHLALSVFHVLDKLAWLPVNNVFLVFSSSFAHDISCLKGLFITSFYIRSLFNLKNQKRQHLFQCLFCFSLLYPIYCCKQHCLQCLIDVSSSHDKYHTNCHVCFSSLLIINITIQNRYVGLILTKISLLSFFFAI